MQPFFSFACRYFAFAVLMILAASCYVVNGQDRDLVCSSRLIPFTSFPQPNSSRTETAASKESFPQDVSDYLKREVLRKQLIARANSYLALPVNQKPDRAVESAVLVVERLLDFGLSPDDPFLIEKTNSLRSFLRSIDTSAGAEELFKFAPAIRALERYRQVLVKYQSDKTDSTIGRNRVADFYLQNGPFPTDNHLNTDVRTNTDVQINTDVQTNTDVPSELRPFYAFISNQFETPTVAQRRLSVILGTENLDSIAGNNCCFKIDSRKNLEKLLDRWESDNLRLAYIQPRLRLINSSDEFPLVLGAAVVFGAATPSGSTTMQGEQSSVVSRISIDNSFSTESLRSLRARGFVLIAQTIVLQV